MEHGLDGGGDYLTAATRSGRRSTPAAASRLGGAGVLEGTRWCLLVACECTGGNGEGKRDFGVDYGFDCWQGTKEGRIRKGEGGGTGLVLMILIVNCESVMMMIYYEVNREEKEGEDGA